jgi:adenine deaminase
MINDIKSRIDVAAGRKKAELVLKNCRIVNVFSSEIIEGDIAIIGGKIAGIGNYEGEEEMDMEGRYAAPGFIDSHVHIESSMVSPIQFARAIVPRGTTTIIADPHEIANVRGIDGIKYILASSENIPLNVFIMLPSCVPATKFENSGAVLEAEELRELIHHPRVIGLGEAMNYPGVIAAEEGIIKKLDLAKGMIIDGHGPGIDGLMLNAYAAGGIRTEHECTSVLEMENRLRLGMYILMRQGTAAQNLRELIRGVTRENMRRCLFCTDDKHPDDILQNGHIDNSIRIAIKDGIDPIAAIQMATINAAECYRLRNIGGIAPGYKADIVIIDNLKDFNIVKVFKNGELVGRDKEALFSAEGIDQDYSMVSNTVKAAKVTSLDFNMELMSDVVNVIRILPHSLLTKKAVRKVDTEDGNFKYNKNLDILKIAVIERHKGTGNIGLGLIEGFELKNGAIALTIAHDSHNLIVIGDSDENMVIAANEVIEIGGGIAICSGGEIKGSLRLPIGGLMSDEPMEEVDKVLHKMLEVAYTELKMNSEIDPFMTLAFMALPVLPEIKLTDMGLFDVNNYEFMDLCITESN